MLGNWSKIYQTAALFFLFPPKRSEYEKWAKNELHTSVSFRSFLKQIEIAARLKEEDWQDFIQGYSDVFYNTRGWDIPLWSSSYRSEKMLLLDENTLAVQEKYEDWGLRVEEDLHEICDHIGIELAFAAFLARAGGERALQELRLFQIGELSFLLGNIVKSVSSLPNPGTEHRSILQLIKLLQEVLSEGIEYMEDLNDDGEPQSSAWNYLYPFFKLYTPVDNKTEPTFINTAGRHNCGGRCFFQAGVKKGNLLRLKFDPKRTPCVKYCVRQHGYISTFLSHRRLRYPMKRVGKRGDGVFRRISWEEAINTIAEEWIRITKQYGPESRYIISSSGVSAIARPDILARRLAALDGGYLAYYNSYSAACMEVTLPYVYGTLFAANSSVFLEKSRLIILWANNPMETVSGGYLNDALFLAKNQGIRIITVDPRYSDTAKRLKAEWFPIRPGTDGALGDAMAYIILSEGLEDRHFIDTYCIGFDEEHMPEGVPYGESYCNYLFGKKDGVHKNPLWAEKITGLPAERIYELARSYALAKPAALLPGLGAQRHSNGEQSVRTHAMLACLTGNVGIAGGSSGGGFVRGYPMPAIPVPQNPYKAVIPSFLWTDAIIRGEQMTAADDGVLGVEKLDSSIKLIFSLAGSVLLNQHSDINRTREILSDTGKCEFIVTSDTFMTPAARFSDILLPATSFFETENIPFAMMEGDYLPYNNVVVPPIFESRYEYDWLKELARKLGLYEEYTQGHESIKDWLQYAYEVNAKGVPELPPFSTFAHNGGHFYKEKSQSIAFREQIDSPENNPFPTPSGKIEIFSKKLYDLNKQDIPGGPDYVPGFEGISDPNITKYPFQLIGWHSKRRCHSIHDNNRWMDKIEKPFVCIHSNDAKDKGINEGSIVEIWNDRGKMQIPAHLTENIMQGVVAVAQGAWYSPDEEGTDKRGSINILTTSQPTPLAKGNPQHSNLVAIRRVID